MTPPLSTPASSLVCSLAVMNTLRKTLFAAWKVSSEEGFALKACAAGYLDPTVKKLVHRDYIKSLLLAAQYSLLKVALTCAGGPVHMDSLNKVTVHASEVISARDTIQTPYSEFNVGSNLPKISEADIAKLAKRQEKEEKLRRAALAQHQVLFCQYWLLPNQGNI